jgi:hypothetical protein
MDQEAKNYLLQLAAQAATSHPSAVAYEGWQCFIQGSKTTSDPSEAIRHATSRARLREHLVHRGLITPLGFDDIDWTAMAKATAQFPPLYRLWISKHVSGFSAFGNMMEHRREWNHSRCPCCQFVREDKSHLLTCPDPSCTDTWLASLAGLEAWMIDVDTAPAIRHCLLRTLATRSITQSFAALSDPPSLAAAQAQDAIGWIHTTEGKISTTWRHLQAAHYCSTGSPRCALNWSAGLITNLLHLTHTQWCHRNAILHARDAKGLKLKDGQALTAAITDQFHLGLDGLHARDRHYISRGIDYVLSRPAANQKAWLSAICIAREAYLASEAREVNASRTIMLNWLAQA